MGTFQCETFTGEDSVYDTLPRRSSRYTNIDLSWKSGGSAFPKTSSRVGKKYQVPVIPDAGSFSPRRDNSNHLYDKIWDHKLAEGAGALNFIHENIVFNRKEAAVIALHSENYKTDNLKEIVSNAPLIDGSNFTAEQKAYFKSEMFRLRKNIVAVAKSTGLGINACCAYYLGKFKKSDDYRLLKVICKHERVEKAASIDQVQDACAICGEGGSLLICDGCEGEFHMACLKPPLCAVPEGVWYCDTCIDSRFLQWRDNLVPKFYDEVSKTRKKRKFAEVSLCNAGSKTCKSRYNSRRSFVLRPTDTVLASVKDFAICIHEALKKM